MLLGDTSRTQAKHLCGRPSQLLTQSCPHVPHPCPLLPVAESSLTGPGSPALPPARVPGQCLQSQRPRTDHLMTRSLVEPVIRTQSPKMPQQRPRFFRGRSSVVAVTPGVTTLRSGQDGPDTTCCPTRGRVPWGTSGPGLSPRDGRHHGARAQPPPTLVLTRPLGMVFRP